MISVMCRLDKYDKISSKCQQNRTVKKKKNHVLDLMLSQREMCGGKKKEAVKWL